MRFVIWPDFRGYRNIKFGLERVFELLSRLNNPHLNLPPTIHISGTNGKGSTLSFLRTIFTEAGLKVHSYTSPHLVNFNERIVVAGEEISDNFLNKVLQECKIAAEKSPAIPITFFEGITVAAFLAFNRINADLLLLETGMGGRLDATNILSKVLCSIITPISFDHQEFLGKTLAKIAAEKAGIIKQNCPVFVGKQKISALKAIKNKATELNSPIKIFSKEWKIKKIRNGFLFLGFGKAFSLPNPSLIGDHQIENASLAIAVAMSQINFKIEENHLIAAMKKTFWQARLQKISAGKFCKILPNNFELYLDGSHNHQGAITIKKFLNKQKNKKIFVIFSMLRDKDCEKFLKKISNQVDELITLTIPQESKSRSAKEILKIAKEIGVKSQVAKNFDDAFLKILKNKSDCDALILICGSLYLAGEFLNQNRFIQT
jgi:dihydrofolate synthase/folylpolyglutamate synthase